MATVDPARLGQLQDEFRKVCRVLEDTPAIDKHFTIPREEYRVRAERLEAVLEAAAAGRVRRVGLLAPRQVVPDGVVRYLEGLAGADNVLDAQPLYYRIKYEKSDNEMRLIRDANVVADAMLR